MKLTADQRDVFRRMGKAGGKARAAKLTAGQRKQSASKAANKRWGKKK